MKDWKKFFKKLLFPPLWVTVLFIVISAGGLVYVFLNGLEEHPVAYAVYIVSFYSLSIFSLFCCIKLPDRYRSVKSKVYSTKYGNRYFTDVEFRAKTSLYISFAVNLVYAAINALSGIIYHTAWFGIFAGYYAVLAVMRFLLVRYVRVNPIGENLLGEWKRAKACALILTLINIILSGAILMIMYQNKGVSYSGLTIYVAAAYTFYITTVAVINIIKYRKYHSPVLSTSKMVTLAAALVSMLSLETAMLTAFGSDLTVETKRLFIALTGAGISIVILSMSVYMTVRATKEIKRFKAED